MSRKPIGEKAMTAADRQRRRRARLRTENPPRKVGRPPLSWLKASILEEFQRAVGCEQKARSARRRDAARQYANFAEQALGLDKRFDGYSLDNIEHFKTLASKKGILEQLGRHACYVLAFSNHDDAIADVREFAELFLKKDPKDLTIKNVVAFFRWLHKGWGMHGDEEPANEDAV